MTEEPPTCRRPNSLLIDTTMATNQGLVVGDPSTLTFASGETKTFTVTGIYKPRGLLQRAGREQRRASTPRARPRWTRSSTPRSPPGVDPTEVRPAVDAAVADNPTVQVQDLTEFKDSFREQINGLLYGIYLLLALALFIAVLGIVNTLALSVVERTREIGLLRAIGTSRRQLRRMIRIESLVTSVFGAVVGLLLGVFFGQMLVRTLADLGLGVVSTPWVSLIVFLVVAAIVGVLAAAWPAWRASRMDVLQAIATE